VGKVFGIGNPPKNTPKKKKKRRKKPEEVIFKDMVKVCVCVWSCILMTLLHQSRT
jgi:hypothetical protein